MELEFGGEIIYWRGPSPYHYVPVPPEESAAIKAVSSQVSYGWGVIPVLARIDDTEWETSLFPKDGRYLVPIKDAGAQGRAPGRRRRRARSGSSSGASLTAAR